MKLELDTLQHFSAALMTLTNVAQSSSPDRMINDALLGLRPLVPFRSAWWGECSDTDANRAARNWLHGRINLSATFAQEWNCLAETDAFAMASMRHLGSVQRFSGHGDTPQVADFARRHMLEHGMAVTVELPGSGLMFFAALYRGASARAFDETEAVLFKEFFLHLLHHWHFRVRELVVSAHVRSSDVFALADRLGNLLYIGAKLAASLHNHNAQWTGSTLPAELAALAVRAPTVFALGAHRLMLQRSGDLIAVSLERSGETTRLPPRERSVALLYAQGRTYKEIARALDLSPATVRTYLRSVYIQLGVHNKIELSGALNASQRKRR